MEQTCSIHSLELCSHSPSRGITSCSWAEVREPNTSQARLWWRTPGLSLSQVFKATDALLVSLVEEKKEKGRVSQSGLQYRYQQITGLDRGPKDQRTEFHADGETFL
ncbi:unnamed protein product [Boreogadus saida]